MQGFRKFPFALLALLILLPGATPVAAQGKEFVVGVEETEYFPIYAYRQGQYVGFSRDLLDAFAAKQGYQFRYVALPILRLFADFLGKDSLDFKYPDNPQWQGEMKTGIEIAYSSPVFSSIEGSMVLPERVGRPVSAVKTLGTIRGFTPWSWSDITATGTVSLAESDNLPSLVQKALVGRVDAMFINTDIADYHLAQDLKRPNGLVLDKGLPHNDVEYLMSSRKHPQVIKEFTAFLASEGALIAELKAKYKLK